MCYGNAVWLSSVLHPRMIMEPTRQGEGNSKLNIRPKIEVIDECVLAVK